MIGKKVAGIPGCIRLIESKESAAFIDRCNCYLLDDRVMIDAGSSICLTESDEVVVLLTHSHGDHSGASHHYKQVRVHASELENVQQGHDPDKIVESFTMHGYTIIPCPNATAIEEGETFLDGSLCWIHTPGHSVGSVCYIWKEFVLFSGDTLYDATFPTVIRERSNTDKWVESLSKLKKILERSTTIKFVLGSHDRSMTPMTRKYAIDKIQRWSEFLMTRTVNSCCVCREEQGQLYVCSECNVSVYCGEECQRINKCCTI